MAVAGTMLALAGSLSACGSAAAPQSAAGDLIAAPARSVLPASVRAAGVLRVGSDMTYPPIEFVQGGQSTGLDVDLAQALGKRLGVRVQFQNITFDDLLGAMSSGRIDAVMSSMTDNAERQAMGVDFVDYFHAGMSVVVAAGNPQHVAGVADLCGRKVAVDVATTYVAVVKAASSECVAAHRPAVQIVAATNDAAAQADVRSGRAAATMSDFPVAAYEASQGGLAVAGGQVEAAPWGIAVPRSNVALRAALQRAVEEIIASGEYDRILAKWHISQGALHTAAIDGGA